MEDCSMATTKGAHVCADIDSTNGCLVLPPLQPGIPTPSISVFDHFVPWLQVWLESGGRVPITDTPGYRAARAALTRARGWRAAAAPGRPLEGELTAMAISVREADMSGE